MTSVGEVTAEEGREKFFVHPDGNQTGDLLLMRRGWYHKTIASAPLGLARQAPARQCAPVANLRNILWLAARSTYTTPTPENKTHHNLMLVFRSLRSATIIRAGFWLGRR
jgi:hypothetical protein